MDRRRGTAPPAPSVRRHNLYMCIYPSKSDFESYMHTAMQIDRVRRCVDPSNLTVYGMIVTGDVTGLDSVTCSGVCEVGHYCEPGAVSATNAPCPAGSYGASTGEHNLLDSLQCLPHSHIRRIHDVDAGSILCICVRPGHVGMQWPLPGRLLLSDGKQRPNGSALRYVKTNARLVFVSA
jgi:hypothetical protein